MNIYFKEAKHLLFVIMYSMIVAFYIFHFQQRAEEWLKCLTAVSC